MQRWGGALLDADTERISEVALGLDEHLMMRRGRFRVKTWGTSIVNVGRGQLLDIVRGRTAKAPTCWLLRRPRESHHLARAPPDLELARRPSHQRRHRGREQSGQTRQRAAFGFTNFDNYRIRALLYAGKPNWALLDTLTPT